jgi:hypothetical protein
MTRTDAETIFQAIEEENPLRIQDLEGGEVE